MKKFPSPGSVEDYFRPITVPTRTGMGLLFGQSISKYDTIRCSTACGKEKRNNYEHLNG